MRSTIKMRFYIISTIFIDLTHAFFIIYDKNAVNYDKNAVNYDKNAVLYYNQYKIYLKMSFLILLLKNLR